MTQLSPNHQEILETVLDWGIVDREQITALCERAGFSAEGIRTALGRLVRDGYLSRDLRNAHHAKAEMGLARKRICYYLAEKGRTHFDFQKIDRERLTGRVKKFTYYADRLPHAIGLSWVHTLLALGHRRKFWTLDWQQGIHTAITTDKRHIPDAVATLTTHAKFTRYIEYEHRNKGEKTVAHARWYFKAFHEGVIDGRVLWVVKTEEKLRSLRARLLEEVPDAGRLFLYLCQEHVELTKPELLFDPVFATGRDKRSWIVDSRKDGQAVA